MGNMRQRIRKEEDKERSDVYNLNTGLEHMENIEMNIWPQW